MTGKSQRSGVPTTALAKSVNLDEEMMHVSLTDGHQRTNHLVSLAA